MNHERLKKIHVELAEAPQSLRPVDKVVLAYAQWQQLSEAVAAAPAVAQATFHNLIDTMAPEDWKGLQQHNETLGADHVHALMRYALTRARDDLTDMARVVENLAEKSHDQDLDRGDNDSATTPTPPFKPTLRRSKRRERER
jgi:hypothetical protein